MRKRRFALVPVFKAVHLIVPSSAETIGAFRTDVIVLTNLQRPTSMRISPLTVSRASKVFPVLERTPLHPVLGPG